MSHLQTKTEIQNTCGWCLFDRRRALFACLSMPRRENKKNKIKALPFQQRFLMDKKLDRLIRAFKLRSMTMKSMNTGPLLITLLVVPTRFTLYKYSSYYYQSEFRPYFLCGKVVYPIENSVSYTAIKRRINRRKLS